MFLPAILIPACASSSPAFCRMYSACKFNKQGDNIQPQHAPFPIWNQSVVPCPVLTVCCVLEVAVFCWLEVFEVFPGGTSGKELSCQCKRHKTWVQSLGGEDLLEEGVVTHSSILAWRIPWTEEPGGLGLVGVTKSQKQLKQLSRQAEILEGDVVLLGSFQRPEQLEEIPVCSFLLSCSI